MTLGGNLGQHVLFVAGNAKDITEMRPFIEPIFRTFCNRRRVHVRPLDIKIIGGRNG